MPRFAAEMVARYLRNCVKESHQRIRLQYSSTNESKGVFFATKFVDFRAEGRTILLVFCFATLVLEAVRKAKSVERRVEYAKLEAKNDVDNNLTRG